MSVFLHAPRIICEPVNGKTAYNGAKCAHPLTNGFSPVPKTITRRLRRFSFLLLIAFIAAWHSPTQAEPRPQARIIGGHAAKASAWPSATLLKLRLANGDTRLCAGNLIASTWILTAAHCFHDQNNKQIIFAADVTAYPGASDVGALSPGDSATVVSVFIHPQFAEAADFDYDFALLELAYPLDTPAASLARARPETDELATAIGWGIQALNPVSLQPLSGSLAQQLQQVTIPVTSDAECREAMGGGVTDNMLCAGYKEGGKDSCNGDSGGPLMVYRDGRYSQIGLVSFGIGCAQPNRYGVYARLTSALPWITELVPQAILNTAPRAERKQVSRLAPENSDNAIPAAPMNTNLKGDEGALDPQPRSGGGSMAWLELLGLLRLSRARVRS